MTRNSVLGLGLFLLLLFNAAPFRTGLVAALQAVLWAGRTVCFDLPARFLRLPSIRAVLASRPVLLAYHYGAKPLVVAAPVPIGLALAGRSAPTVTAAGAASFLAAGAFLNSRLGRGLEEAFLDWLVRSWHYLHLDLVPGVFRFVMGLFKALLESVERMLYTVDEWLRFRSGEGRLSLVGKAALGLVWFGLTYVVRFCINLLIEPQINPIKHFPVVTVSHKLVLTLLVPPLIKALTLTMDVKLASTVALTIAAAIPGVFGFLVWEFKENWRLYRANRPPRLQPVPVGHHGETLIRLLRPGFHSGTLPKLYAKVRRAERRAHVTGSWDAARRHRAALYDVEEAVRRLVEREFLLFLEGSPCWGPGRVTAGEIELGSNRIRVELRCPGRAGASAWVAFEELSGWLVAGVATAGWLGHLSPEQAGPMTTALAGLYKKGGVDLIRQQIEAELGAAAPAYDIAGAGIVVWPGDGYDCEAVYPLRDGRLIEPRVITGPCGAALPTLDAGLLLFRDVPIAWEHWVETWERDQAGDGQPKPFLPGVRLLPDAPAGAVS
jgi:hypothetical protein